MRHTDHLARAGLDAAGGWPIHRGSGEQSNTSLRIGDGAILKVIRKLEQGVHPELEIGRFLTGEADFSATPALLGWSELEGATSDEVSTLSVLQAFVANEGDGWAWTLERLSQVGQPGGDRALEQATAWLRRLGARTAEMHRAFGIDTLDPAFRPEPAGAKDFRTWTEAAHAMAGRALDGLAAAGERLGPQALGLAEALLARRSALAERLDTLLRETPSFAKTRHHGDYHLGQVLVAGDDAVIVDFEGEPLRPLAERRARHAPLRDVAGLLRSLAYAAAAAGRALPTEMPADAREAAQRHLDTWEAEASRAFLGAYLEVAQASPGCPQDQEAAGRVVRFFMLEKALYEIAYEIANRPDWVAIPVRGVLALLDSGDTQEDTGGPALNELAERMGIEPEFCNAHGQTVRTSAGTKCRLLAAMGVQATDEAQARAALEALEWAKWQRPLPPVVVWQAEAGAPAVEVVRPANSGEITCG
jgi:trehalose synthase-fused probable maltokinase